MLLMQATARRRLTLAPRVWRAPVSGRCTHRDAEAISEAVQRPTMNFVTIKTPEQSDLLSLHSVRSRLVCQRTAIINQVRGFLIECGSGATPRTKRRVSAS